MKKFIREIHRRSLWQVLGIYIVGAWVVLQVVEVLGTIATLPEWFPGFALGLLVLGLPFVLATAFVQEGGPGNHESSTAHAGAPSDGGAELVANGLNSEPEGGAAAARLFTWRNAFLGGLGGFAILGFGGTAWFLFGGAIGPGGSGGLDAPVSIDPSIAVLRFDDLSPGGDQQYFVEGLSEEIINALAQITELKVSARTSTFTFQDLGLDVSAIADSLGVANILEGSVRRDGEQIRITAQLIEAGTGFHLWSDNYDRELTAIFAIQDEISRSIADRLQLTLTGEQAEVLVQGGTEIPEAHEAYLLGRSFWNRRTPEGLRAAIAEFERAISLDPEYAQAYSGLADSYAVMEVRNDPFLFDARAAAESAVDAAERVVELAPELGMAHASLGRAYMAAGRWDEAEAALDRALSLSPGYAVAHYWRGLVLYDTGRQAEAQASLLRARELDPTDPTVAGILWASYAAEEDWEMAEAELRRAIEMQPTDPNNWAVLSWILVQTGQTEGAVEAALRLDQLSPPEQRMPEVEATFRDFIAARMRRIQTGEPQPFPPSVAEAAAEVPMFALMAASALGQSEALIAQMRILVDLGAYGAAAGLHQTFLGAIAGDDPDYQALISEIGLEP